MNLNVKEFSKRLLTHTGEKAESLFRFFTRVFHKSWNMNTLTPQNRPYPERFRTAPPTIVRKYVHTPSNHGVMLQLT